MKKINLIKVKSGHIESIGWEKEYLFDEDSKKIDTLRIKFNDGAIYDYEKVVKRTFAYFLVAKSKGTFFVNRIKNRYKTIKRK